MLTVKMILIYRQQSRILRSCQGRPRAPMSARGPLVPAQPTLVAGAVPTGRPQAAPDVLYSMEDEGGPRAIIEASPGANL
jgi:hypothetical protein